MMSKIQIMAQKTLLIQSLRSVMVMMASLKTMLIV
jgi:hypothetical protein